MHFPQLAPLCILLENHQKIIITIIIIRGKLSKHKNYYYSFSVVYARFLSSFFYGKLLFLFFFSIHKHIENFLLTSNLGFGFGVEWRLVDFSTGFFSGMGSGAGHVSLELDIWSLNELRTFSYPRTSKASTSMPKYSRVGEDIHKHI